MTDFIPNTALKLLQDDTSFRMTSEAIHLTTFFNIRKNDRVLDVGCSSGVLSLVAASQTNNTVIGIDIEDAAIELARSNARLNALSNLDFVVARLQNYASSPFDVIVCNPPYYKSSQTVSQTQISARFDQTLTLEELALNAFRLLKDKGRLVIIIPVERFHDWLFLAHSSRLAVKRCAFIHHSPDHSAKTVLVEAVKNGKGTLKVQAPIFNHE